MNTKPPFSFLTLSRLLYLDTVFFFRFDLLLGHWTFPFFSHSKTPIKGEKKEKKTTKTSQNFRCHSQVASGETVSKANTSTCASRCCLFPYARGRSSFSKKEKKKRDKERKGNRILKRNNFQQEIDAPSGFFMVYHRFFL